MSDKVPGAERFIFSNKTKGSRFAPQGVTLIVKISPNKQGTLEKELAPEDKWSCYALLSQSSKIQIVIREKPGPRGSTAYGTDSFEHRLNDGRTTNVVIRTSDNAQPPRFQILTS